jgi:hypothetical protein
MTSIAISIPLLPAMIAASPFSIRLLTELAVKSLTT